jgi:hypothetical protein
VKRYSFIQSAVVATALLVYTQAAFAQAPGLSPETQIAANQQQVAANQQQQQPVGQEAVTGIVKKYHVGVDGGIGLDPEIIIFGAHGTFGPIVHKNVNLRPGFELGFGELTTMVGFNIDFLFSVADKDRPAKWTPYLGIGPNFALSHKSIEEAIDQSQGDQERDRFDFGDTSFDTGLNFIVGMKRSNGLFAEMKATAYGVSTIRLMAGFDF